MHPRPLQPAHDIVLLPGQTVQRGLHRFFAADGLGDIAPPKLGQFRIIRHIRAGRRPLDPRRAAVKFNQAAQIRRPFGKALMLHGGIPHKGQTDMALAGVNGLGDHKLGIQPGRLAALHRRGFHQCPGAGILITELHAFLPIGPVRRRRDPPFGRAVHIDHGGAFFGVLGHKGRVPECLLRDVAGHGNRGIFIEGHAHGLGRRIFFQPLNRLGQRINRGGAVDIAAPLNSRTGRMAALDANAPFIDRLAVRQTAITGPGHGKPGVGIAPAQRGVLLAVVHAAINGLAINLPHLIGEEFRDVLIG